MTPYRQLRRVKTRYWLLLCFALWLGGVYWGASHAQDVMGPCAQRIVP